MGVWYPDGIACEMGWQGSSSRADSADTSGLHSTRCYNPFAAVPDEAMVLTYTMMLQHDAKNLQWAMRASASGTPARRGNKGSAVQDTRPSWLSKPGFLDFCRCVMSSSRAGAAAWIFYSTDARVAACCLMDC